jgi:hypothetical protein
VYVRDQTTRLMSLCCEDVSTAVWLSAADFAATATAAMRSVQDIIHRVSQSNDVIRFIYGHHPAARRRMFMVQCPEIQYLVSPFSMAAC